LVGNPTSFWTQINIFPHEPNWMLGDAPGELGWISSTNERYVWMIRLHAISSNSVDQVDSVTSFLMFICQVDNFLSIASELLEDDGDPTSMAAPSNSTSRHSLILLICAHELPRYGFTKKLEGKNEDLNYLSTLFFLSLNYVPFLSSIGRYMVHISDGTFSWRRCILEICTWIKMNFRYL
ncbi:hypothetical protein ACJX0J_006610, partial [Zea mays]